MLLKDVKLWSIYFAAQCKCTRPTPKDKLVVVVGIDNTTILSFLICSEISTFVQKRPHHLEVQVSIDCTDHSCLKYDSYVDCAYMCKIEPANLTIFRDPVSQGVKDDILKAVKKSKPLENRYKKLIK